MRFYRTTAIVLGLLIALALGCQKATTPEPKPSGSSPKQGGAAPAPKTKSSVEPGDKEKEPSQPPAPPSIPKVTMLPAQLETALVKVGDSLPDADLPDLDGKPKSVRKLLARPSPYRALQGSTVVLCWTSENPYAVEGLNNLVSDVTEQDQAKGVAVIGIAVRDKPDAAKAAVEQAKAKFVNLLDEDGAYYAKLSTGKLPRIYLVNPAGKVLWFDVEYSNATGRDLKTAIRAVLGEK
jgi:peroxiredoxin